MSEDIEDVVMGRGARLKAAFPEALVKQDGSLLIFDVKKIFKKLEPKPKRVQRKRTRGWRMPPNTVYVGRPSSYGNPWKVVRDGVETFHVESETGTIFETQGFYWQRAVDYAIDAFRHYALTKAQENPNWLAPLRGKNLACFCRIDRPCHADVLLDLANSTAGFVGNTPSKGEGKK